jgi:hypothetical protein
VMDTTTTRDKHRASRSSPGATPHRRRRHSFYLAMSLLIAAIVAFGFGQALDARLIHPPSARPSILYVHVVLFTGWVLILIMQATLVRIGRVNWHRCLGVLGIVMGAAMPLVGIATALVMTRLEAGAGGVAVERQAFLAVSCFDMVAFATLLWTAVRYRRRPEYHRRLMLMATCGLTVAAFARFPSGLVPDNGWYLGVDALILAGVIRDWITEGRVHPVYAIGLPAIGVGQAATMWVYLTRAPAWLAIARVLLP